MTNKTRRIKKVFVVRHCTPQDTGEQIPHAKANFCLFDFVHWMWLETVLSCLTKWYKETTINHLCTDISAKPLHTVRGENCSRQKRLLSSFWNPHSVRPVLHVSSGFEPSGWQSEPEVPVLCAAVRLGFDTGQSDQSYANGNQMGRESPVDYRRRREACVFMYSYGDLGPLFFFLPFFSLLSLSQTREGCLVCCLHAPLINAVCDFADFEICANQ